MYLGLHDIPIRFQSSHFSFHSHYYYSHAQSSSSYTKHSTLPVPPVDQVTRPHSRPVKPSSMNTYRHSRHCLALPSLARSVVDVWILRLVLLNHWRSMVSGPKRIMIRWRVNFWPSWRRLRVRVCMRLRRLRLRLCKEATHITRDCERWCGEIIWQ